MTKHNKNMTLRYTYDLTTRIIQESFTFPNMADRTVKAAIAWVLSLFSTSMALVLSGDYHN